MNKMIKLESVGTMIDADGMTYPMLAGGGYDADEGTHVGDMDVDGDWWNNLSDTDWSAGVRLRQLTRNIKVCGWCGSAYRADPVEPTRYCSDDCATDSHNLEEPR